MEKSFVRTGFSVFFFVCFFMKLSKCTHTAGSSEQTHIHTVNTHLEQWDAIVAAAPGEQLGVQCLAQGSHLSRGIEGGGALYIHSPHLLSLLVRRLKPGPFGLRV